MSYPTTLTQKMSDLLSELDRHLDAGVTPSFGTLRGLLGKKRVLILPHIKTQHEVILPDSSPELARATVLVEIALVDAESGDQLSSRWIGQAIDAPMVATERAVTQAMEDFLQKTFLVLPGQGSTLKEPRATPSQIRRRPQGAPSISPSAHSPAPDERPPAPLDAPSEQAKMQRTVSESQSDSRQLDLLEMIDQPAPLAPAAANEDAPSNPLPPLTKEWKTANALWRALVNEVASSEIMDAFEDALERQHGVDSWRRVEPAKIRAICQQLKKRSALPSDIRKMSDREEFILSKLPFIPDGSSLHRLNAELQRLATEVVEPQRTRVFLDLYLRKMNASSLAEVPGKAAIALARKLRKLKGEDREAFILDALEEEARASTSAA